MPKRIAILGSTGSIGCNALDVVQSLGSPYRAVAISGHTRTDKLLEQVRQHRPAAVAITDHVVDDANIDRFCQMVREFAATSQMIIVTHNKKTMESADRMYGVTTREAGVSAVVSAELAAAEAVMSVA